MSRDAGAVTQVPPPVAAPTMSDAQRRVAEFLARVGVVRRLAPLSPVEAKVLDRAALIANVREHVEREIPAEVLRNQGELLIALGLLPVDYDYQEGSFELLKAQLAGFYEPHDKRMYLAADLVDRAADATLAHELVHALQDQHYDLGTRLTYKPEANDQQSAVQGLAEGDATSAMMDLILAEQHNRAVDVPDDVFAAEVEGSMSATPETANVPRVLRASLVAPYVDGVLFVHALRRRQMAKGSDTNGWAGVDEAWRAPPETTEQLLHLAKYDAHEPAEVVDEPAPPRGARSGEWVSVYQDVFGEQGLRVAAEEWLSKKGALTLASGWGGDRAVVFRAPVDGGKAGTPAAQGIQIAAAWHIRFDPGPQGRPDEYAQRAFQLLSKSLGAGAMRRGQGFCLTRKAVGPVAVVRAGRDLALVAGPYTRDGERVASDTKCPQSLQWASEVAGAAIRPTAH